jgi:hypothetical protein
MTELLDPPKHDKRNKNWNTIVVGFKSQGCSEPQTVRGQTARTLLALHKAGQEGVTAQEVSSWALRLAAYVLELRKRDLKIQTIRESHPGGWHGRYVLHTSVEIAFCQNL